MRGAWFYMTVFVVAVGMPAVATYFMSVKYEDVKLFIVSTGLCASVVGGALIFSYLRARKAGTKHGQSQ